MATMKSGFFSHHSPVAHEKTKHFINVGGELFHAVAVSLIDYLKGHGALQEEALKRVLKAYNNAFPNSIPNGALRTPQERMMGLLNSPRQTELVERMAYVVRQMVVDVIYEDPTHLAYRAVFNGLEPQTPKDYLYGSAPMDVYAVRAALIEALGLPIILSYKTREKILRKRVGFEKEASSLSIQVQQDQYYPGVRDKYHFNSVGKLAIKATPVTRHEEGTLAQELHLIETDNKRLLSALEHQQRILTSMVEGDEVSLQQLIGVYIALSPKETENAAFVIELQQHMKPGVAEAPVNDIELIINALASWVAVGAISSDKLYEQLETTIKAVPAAKA